MAAVIRMKRHISEEPHSAFILNCKRQKTDSSKQLSIAPGETSTVLKFAGTVNQDTDISEHIAKRVSQSKVEAKDIVTRKKPESGLQKRLDQNREKSQQNRFKIVNYTRGVNSQSHESSEELAPVNLTIVDVEKDQTINSLANETGTTSSAQASSYSDISDDPFVYDIYIADTESVVPYPDSIDLNDLSILDYNHYHEFAMRPPLVNSDAEDDDDQDEDEDSNDENNWRNDYPEDEEMSDNESVGERDMIRAMNNCDIGQELSSDEEDHNGFVYSVDSEAISFEDDLDYCDVNRYGEAYARYKKRVVRELKDEDSASDSDDDQETLSRSDSYHSD